MRPAVICISGKRKSGKDFVSKHLAKLLTDTEGLQVSLCGVSYPLKDEYARIHHLNNELLKTSGPYKEIHREKMVEWGEKIRRKDPHYFCRATISNIGDPDVIIITDCRRPSDIEFFSENFGEGLRLVRIESGAAEREARGFRYTSGIDDCDTECALDSREFWHFVVRNNENTADGSMSASLQADLECICCDIKGILARDES